MTDAQRIQIEGRALLLFDGVCGLCNRTVRTFLKRDRRGVLLYIPLQSELAGEILARFGIHTFPDGLILVTHALTADERLHHRTDAVAQALRLVGGAWSALGGLILLFPRFLREFVYGVVARNRYRLFGRYDACPVPTLAERSRILGL